jgi:hypothetical protein
MAEDAFGARIPEANESITVGGDDRICASEEDGLGDQL